MNARLISFTVPCIDDLPLDSDVLDLVAYCARVSNPSNQGNTDTSEKLINYLIKNKHWSPFEMADITLEIVTTRDISHQIVRHRSYAFQEFSQRYADPTKEMKFVLSEARLQDSKNRQNSIEIDDPWLQAEWDRHQQEIIDLAKQKYEWAISKGLAKEVARKVLPEGLTETRLYMKGSVRSWIHYLEVRTDPSTQKEHREIALACAQAIAEIFPMITNSVHPSNSLPTEFIKVETTVENA
jgi:thymidylate synthase (FAD)